MEKYSPESTATCLEVPACRLGIVHVQNGSTKIFHSESVPENCTPKLISRVSLNKNKK